MPSRANPTPPRVHDDGIVQIQCDNRGATGCGQSYQVNGGIVPFEMIVPNLGARMKEPDAFAGERIESGDGCAFEFVATPAGKAEVVKCGRATLRFWNDVVKRHGLPGVRFRGVAIRTSPIISGEKLLLQIGRGNACSR